MHGLANISCLKLMTPKRYTIHLPPMHAQRMACRNTFANSALERVGALLARSYAVYDGRVSDRKSTVLRFGRL